MLQSTPKLAFVDVETTGSSPEKARVTEVGILVVQWPTDGLGPPHAQRWSSLVGSDTAIPEEIRFLTGISNDMLRDAPDFASLAPTILELLEDAVFVAHHARFDYGFIKAEMARAGRKFSAKTLCTVRLSRLLNPDKRPHTLDALIIRHGLPCPDRHRALGDAQVLWHFLQCMMANHGIETTEQAIARLLRKPNLPAHLGLESVEQIPARPGIYFFHGLNAHPLYIGKSSNIRQRIASHFCGDHQSERGMRLASETRRISWQETAGEFSALLAEINAIDQQMPAHNKALRRNRQAVAISFETGNPKPVFIDLAKSAEAFQTDDPLYGPYSSRAAARNRLKHLASEHGWCLKSMGLERGAPGAPCFARQLRRCDGACVGEISQEQLQVDIATIMSAETISTWAAGSQLLVVEHGYGLINWHLFAQWCWLRSGCHPKKYTNRIFKSLSMDDQSKFASRFDRNVYRLLHRYFEPLPDQHAPRLDGWHQASTHRDIGTHLLICKWFGPELIPDIDQITRRVNQATQQTVRVDP